MATPPTTPERLFGLRELTEAGYGDRRTITKIINNGQVPARRIGTAFKIRESDLHLIGAPLGATALVVQPNSPATDTALGGYIKTLIDTFPKLNDEQKGELGRLLASAA